MPCWCGWVWAFRYTALPNELTRVGQYVMVAVFPVSLPRYAFGMMKWKSTRTDSPRRRREGVAKRDGGGGAVLRAAVSISVQPINVRL